MAAFLNDRVLDNGLTILDTEATNLYICSQQPTTFTEASSTYALGSKSGISIGAPADGASNGRRVTLAAITDGSVSASGTATHFAITDNTNSRLLAAQALSASQGVTNGNSFSLGTVDITIPDAA